MTLRWRNEALYTPLIQAAATRYGVPVALIQGVIARESGFDPEAFNPEGSRGLMQLRDVTARALGYKGTMEDLYDPATNIDLGAKLLAENLRARGGDLDAALSQYNGGYRPVLGFGARLPDGTFRNQDYVIGVRHNITYFAAQQGTSLAVIEAGLRSGPGVAGLGLLGGLGFLGAAVARRWQG